MKEFDMNNNEMNEQNSVENKNVNTDSQNTNPQTVNEQNTQETKENVNTSTVNNSTTPVPENHRTETPYSGNPYFEGFAQNNNQQTNNQQYNAQQNNTQQNAQQNTQYTQNTQNNQYGQQTQYTQNSQNTQYGYNQNNHGYGYNQNQNGGYTPNHTYNAPHQAQGQISYTPNTAKVKKEKKSKPVTRGALALVVAMAVVLSGAVGYGSAMLASRNVTASQSVTSSETTSQPSSTTSSDNGNVVIYKSVDEVATSTGDSSDNYTTAEVAAMVKDSVVEINTEYTSTSRGWYNYVQQGAGSGVIISTDGYIITNCHVIMDEDTNALADTITVRLTNGNEYDASIVGYDSESDIAIVKIDATGLTAAQCGDSDKLVVGEELLVVGNPLGELGGTVTNGIVSATEREIEVNGVKMNLIQTNAAVNPGNSGGGMFNMKGQLVGIVNAKSSGTGIEGLGFAIPVNEALDVAEQLLQYGYVRGKTMIGVSFSEVSSNSFYFYYNIKAGVYVESLTEGYNDDVLQPGDRVVAVNGNTVSTVSEIKSVVTSSSVGDKLKFQIERNGKLMEVEVECFEKVPDSNSIEFSEDNQSETTETNSNSFGGSIFGN